MYSVLCPACHFVNPANARCCQACSTAFFQDSALGGLDPLVAATLAERQGWQSHRMATQPSPDTPTALSSAALQRRRTDLPQPSEPITLIDPLPSPGKSAPASPTSLPPTPFLPERRISASPAASGFALDNAPDRRTVAKALARQAARRARLEALADERTAPPPTDVLVLDPDADTRQALHALLARFGFMVHEAQDLADAERLAHASAFVAAFLEIRLDEVDDGRGLDLCQHLHGRSRGGTAVVLMSRHVRPSDKVRATLARGDALLAKPLSRGDVARTLESCGVVLPADERRR